MEKDFENFITERINHNYDKLRKTKKWQKEIDTFNLIHSNLYEELSLSQKEKLDKLIESKNSLMYFESIFAYKLAFSDIINIFKL